VGSRRESEADDLEAARGRSPGVVERCRFRGVWSRVRFTPTGGCYSVAHPAPIRILDRRTGRSLFALLDRGRVPKAVLRLQPPIPLSQKSGLVASIKFIRPMVDEAGDNGIERRPAGDNSLVGHCALQDGHTASLWVYASG